MTRINPFKSTSIATLFVIALTSSFQASAAGFDCRQATQADEKAVCADGALSEKDVQMTTTYNLFKGLLLMGARGALQDEQREWLKARRQCGANHACLSLLYDQRINALTEQFNKMARIINAG
jgi:uncharacterized protein